MVNTIALLLVIAIPLGAVFVQSLNDFRTRQAIKSALVQSFENTPGVDLVNPEEVEIQDLVDFLVVTIPVFVRESLPESYAESSIIL